MAGEHPVAELLRLRPFVDQLGTRLVLQTATEEDSVALLGMDGAERVGALSSCLALASLDMPRGASPPGWLSLTDALPPE